MTDRATPEREGVPVRRHVPTLIFRGLVGLILLVSAVPVVRLTGSWEPFLDLSSDRERMQRMVDDAGMMAPIVYMALLVAQAIAAPLPAPALAMGAGYSFGMYEGFLLTWFGALLGGVASFWISRWIGRDYVAGSERMQRLDRYVDEHGTITIFVLRLLPLVSFDAISYAAGLSSISFSRFLCATALGMLPGTAAFVYLGGASSSTGTAMVLTGLALLAAATYLYQRRNLRIRRRVRRPAPFRVVPVAGHFRYHAPMVNYRTSTD
ncbi:MAG: TVP38/TMEM64 family protein [Rubrobacter sp.]